MLPLLPLADTERLRKLILMLSSDNEGERQVAVSKIGQLLIRCNLDWHDLAAVLTASATASGDPACPQNKVKPAQDGHYRIADADLLDVIAAIREGAPLDGYQRRFLESMEDRAARYAVVFLSPKQFAYLTGLWKEM